MKRAPRPSRLALGGALVVIAIGGLAQPAFAHVETDPASVPAGSTEPIGFNVEHGCDESSTVKVEMQLPEGVTDPKIATVEGWESSVAGRVITWTGGPQPHDVALLLTVEMTFPNSPGEVLTFPTVQTCEQGEIRWVDPPNPDGSEAEDPAPLVTLTAAQGETTTTTAASTTAAASTTVSPATTAAASTTAAAATTAVPESDEGSDNTAAVIAIVAVAILAVVGGGAWLLARRT